MSKLADPDGDLLIDVFKREFTLTDAARLARVPSKSVRNWMARDILHIGIKNPLTGRWYFSIADIIRLSALYDLCVRPGVDFGPTKAAPIADVVVRCALDSTDPKASRDGIRPNVSVIVAWSEEGDMLITTADIKEPGKFYPPKATTDYEPLRRAVIVIQATALMADVVLRTQELARTNRRQEAPWHA